MWDGNPVLDRKLFYEQPDNKNAPPDSGLIKSLGLVPEVETTEAPATRPCGYCGVEVPTFLPEDGAMHRCWGGLRPGTVTKEFDGKYRIVLEADAEHVVYYEFPNSSTISPDEFFSDMK